MTFFLDNVKAARFPTLSPLQMRSEAVAQAVVNAKTASGAKSEDCFLDDYGQIDKVRCRVRNHFCDPNHLFCLLFAASRNSKGGSSRQSLV